jgi:hypothetical protein
MDLAIFLWHKGALNNMKLLLIVAAAAIAFCLFGAIVCLVAASREMDFPDIEDIEIAE